eukprot:maker-scaffold403_size186359-snap-gene-0.51 protein:Tk07445 transcript:maker-scaffold403_size186359-snap-gene-0.51-mRNA-1 annotation:"hypothetical protein DAPPUDRAFT_99667"
MSMPLDPFSCPPLWSGGPDPGGYYAFPQVRPQPSRSLLPGNFKQHSQYPITTGSSVFGIRYKDGVVLAADTLGSYGSLARYPDIRRVIRVNETTVVACSGDFADFQFLQEVIHQKQVDEDITGGGVTMKPEALHCWITRFLYNKRSKFDPLWTTVIVGGMQDDKPFLGYCNYIGVAFKDDTIATGIGMDLAVPIMREATEKKKASELTLEEAKEIIRKCVAVCFLRDCRSSPRYNMAVVNQDGAVVEEPVVIETNWEYAKIIKGYE